MNTSRSVLDQLLDTDNESVTLNTLQNAARAIGAHLEMKLEIRYCIDLDQALEGVFR